jgi:hypothetical protein
MTVLARTSSNLPGRLMCSELENDVDGNDFGLF